MFHFLAAHLCGHVFAFAVAKRIYWLLTKRLAYVACRKGNAGNEKLGPVIKCCNITAIFCYWRGEAAVGFVKAWEIFL